MKRQMKYERIFNTDGGCKKGNCNKGTLQKVQRVSSECKSVESNKTKKIIRIMPNTPVKTCNGFIAIVRRSEISRNLSIYQIHEVQESQK